MVEMEGGREGRDKEGIGKGEREYKRERQNERKGKREGKRH